MSMLRNAEQSIRQLNDAVVRNTNIAKKKAAELLKRLFPQILLQSLAIILTATGAYFLMTWIVQDLAQIQSTYGAAALQILGALVLMVLVLVSINTRVYRKRLQEITTLTDAITQVAAGHFDYRIHVRRREPMATVYEDFNKMTDELSSVQLLRNDFINSYSHEFKTPIACINGFASLLLERDLPEGERRQYLTIIRDESERLTALSTNTILLSKLSSTHIVTDAEPYDLAQQLRQCAIIASPGWTEKQQELICELPALPYTGSRELMQHLWLNLINNAVKYTQPGGTITIDGRTDGESLLVSVTDNGPGMNEQTRLHLFEPYYQGDASRATQGLGLGLAIAHRIAELAGGSIEVTSRPGAGSTFTVHLPRHSEPVRVN